MDPKLRLSTSMSPVSESDKLEMRRNIPFRQLLGSLQYARLTRPDAIQAISSVAKFSNNPECLTTKPPSEYFAIYTPRRTTVSDYKSSGLAPGQPWNIEVYVDADWANDPDFRRSRSGFTVMANNNPISFGSGLQPKTSSSTPVAEYVALASAVKELIWLKQLLRELNVGVTEPVTVHEDNTTCIHIAKNPASPKRTRHIDIRYHFLRDYVVTKEITVEYCKSKDMLADILTKALPRPAFQRIRGALVSDDLMISD
jgi:hypothetical protein